MCRLFGYVSHTPTSPSQELGAENFEEFTALTRIHADGWGMAWNDPQTGRVRVTKSTQRADLNPEYADLSTRTSGASGFVHLRWATASLAVTQENTHPFLDDDMAFAHNGHIAPIEQLESFLTRDSRARLTGTTDSERYFQFIRQSIERTGNTHAGVTEALRTLIRHFPNASLNALLLTTTHLFAIHVNSRADSPEEQLRARLETSEALPARHGNEYYAMDYRSTPTHYRVISSGLARERWTPAPTDAAVAVDLATRKRERLDLLHTA